MGCFSMPKCAPTAHTGAQEARSKRHAAGEEAEAQTFSGNPSPDRAAFHYHPEQTEENAEQPSRIWGADATGFSLFGEKR